MNPEVKELWIAALESGEFSQTQNRLRDDDGYCCLGVLCELAVQRGVIEPAKKLHEDSDTFCYDDAEVVLPTSVMEWAGLQSDSGSLSTGISIWDHYSFKAVSLAQLNDEANYDFKQIAQVIREQF